MSASEKEAQLSTEQSDKSGQIVHESETQRQFIRLKMPAQSEIDGMRYTAKDLSSGGMAIAGFEKMPRKSSRHDIKLILPFFDFSLDIDLTAEVVHTDKKTQSAGFRFVDMNANQLSILNHILSAFISGDIVSGNSILNVASRDNFVKVRHHSNENEPTPAQVIKKYTLYSLFVLLTFGFSFFIINNILNRLTVISTAQAYVSAPKTSVQARTSGLFKTSLTQGSALVKKGQIIGGITIPTMTENGISTNNVIPVLSPCDCFIDSKNVDENAYVIEGNTLFTLIPQKTEIYVSALISMEEAARLKAGTRAKIHIAVSGVDVKGTVSEIEVTENSDLTGLALQSRVTIKPETSLSHDEINRPAFIEFYL